MGIEVIENYAKPEKVNPFIAELKGLAVDTVFADTFEVKRNEDGTPKGVAARTQLVQAGARANGFTARVQEVLDNGDTVKIIFKTYPAQKSSPRKPRAPKVAE